MVQIAFRYLSPTSYVHIVHNAGVVPESHVRFYTVPCKRLQQGAALFASIAPEACHAVCAEHPEFVTHRVRLADAKDIASTLRLPLLVPMDHMCDIATHNEIQSFFVAQPDRLETFHRHDPPKK